MKRDLESLTSKTYDLIIIGGGIFGACAAWDAVSRGLSVALVEKRDFAHATSANSFRMVHGGIRYIQHLNFSRVRRAMKERRALLRIAPHLAHPLPIIVPVYGRGMRGKEALRMAFFVYDLVSMDRNRGIIDKARQIPRGYILSPSETIRRIPGLKREGLAGGAVFYDGQMYNQSRLALSFLRSAVNAGADAANYLEATGFLRSGNTVAGIKATDAMTGNELEIKGHIVLNAAGPWVEHLLRRDLGIHLEPRGTYSRDLCLIIRKPLMDKFGIAVQGRTRDSDALLSRERRHLFVVPWQKYTLVGVWHLVHKGGPDHFAVNRDELESYINEINEAYPGLSLDVADISMWNAGLVLFGGDAEDKDGLSFGKQSRLIDHAKEHGMSGIVSLIGARYSTARGDASVAIDLIFSRLGKHPPKSLTDVTPIFGGNIENFQDLVKEAGNRRPQGLSSEIIQGLLHNHGSEYHSIMDRIHASPEFGETLGDSTVVKAEVIHAVGTEMAMKLEDVVFRRTDLGTAGFPGEEALKTCAGLMALEMGWTPEQEENELREVMNRFQTVCPSFMREHTGVSMNS